MRINNVAAAKTLLYITAATNNMVEILSAKITNEDNETNEQILCTIQKITTLGTPTATTLTGAKHEKGSATMSSTVKGNVTAAEPTYGAIAQDADIVDAFDTQGTSSLGGWFHSPIPEERVYVSGGDSYGLRLVNAPAVAIDLAISFTFREIN
ncbi:MAG: hypothetical protein AABY07_11010 [Nanoarchaeota archaeon]